MCTHPFAKKAVPSIYSSARKVGLQRAAETARTALGPGSLPKGRLLIAETGWLQTAPSATPSCAKLGPAGINARTAALEIRQNSSIRIRLRGGHQHLTAEAHIGGAVACPSSLLLVGTLSISGGTVWRSGLLLRLHRRPVPKLSPFASSPKMRTEPKARILEVLSKFAETRRRADE